MATISKRETVGNVAERTSINSLCELKHDTDFFQRHAFNHQPELRTLGFFVHCWECLLREEGKTLHTAPLVLHRSVSGIVFRHFRAHVTDDGLYHGKRDACKSGVVAERDRHSIHCNNRRSFPPGGFSLLHVRLPSRHERTRRKANRNYRFCGVKRK